MKKGLGFAIVIVIVLSMFGQNFSNFFSASDPEAGKKKEYTDVFDKLYAYEASDVEKIIREAEIERQKKLSAELRQKKINETLLNLRTGKISYRKVFANTCFVGDSLLNGLEVYNILNPDRLITQVSARLGHLEDNLKKIVAMNPKILILHYGVNNLWDNDTGMGWFIDDYTELVLKLKKALPYTRIIVSSIFPVDEELATAEIFTYIPKHNQALKKMCAATGVEFLDSTSLVAGCKDYYASDGIHFTASFYSEKWLPFIVANKGITG